ncbi:MAG TPA: sigma-70 family RNA polymerase sigma factor [Arachidicoccus sp.]|nr:sigma-70 family RNA polymerase sigma factor [Arachidicoccus sp.]
MLELLKNDDAEAFREFYFLWDERLYFYFLKKVTEENCAHDLTQLTFIKMWKYRSSLTDQHTLEVQLFRKAKHVYIDWLRKEATVRKQKEAEIQYFSEPATQDELHPETEKLQNALKQLPPMRRKVIELSHLQGYGYKEIAQKLNISVKTVDNHIYQALKQLRKILSLFIF